jgi:iron complex transport system ATP-binding protein
MGKKEASMLRVEGINFRVPGRTLLHETTLQFEPGRFHVIMGANGAGKSTLLKLLAGELQSVSGKIWLDDADLSRFTKKELALKRAVLSQHYHLSFPISVPELVMMGRYPHFAVRPSTIDHSICREAMQLMQVDELADRDYNTLSGGEAQKAQMGRVLAQIWNATEGASKLLFLDEPVSHLDIRFQHQLLQTARDLTRKHTTVIAILHDINLALSFADRIIFMKEGRVVHDLAQPSNVSTTIIRDVFDVEASIMQPPDHHPVIIF